MIVRGMRGLGDNIYQRAFVKALQTSVYLDTPWPELYADLPHVYPVCPQTELRTQLKNVNRQPREIWRRLPRSTEIRIRYAGQGIVAGMQQCFGVAPAEFDLPNFGPSPVAGRYVVVRPVTVRSEWRADARNPEPRYIARAAGMMQRRGYTVVSVADLEEGKEWVVGELPPADIRYHAGELPVSQLLALVQGAAALIGGIGWIVPAAIAARVPAWIVCGGQGGYNAPELITVPGAPIEFAVPDRFCRCTLKQHDCDKRISNHDPKFAAWADRLPAVV